jgi:hypothetical protein
MVLPSSLLYQTRTLRFILRIVNSKLVWAVNWSVASSSCKQVVFADQSTEDRLMSVTFLRQDEKFNCLWEWWEINIKFSYCIRLGFDTVNSCRCVQLFRRNVTSTLKINSLCPSDTLVRTYKNTRCQILEGHIMNPHCLQEFTSYIPGLTVGKCETQSCDTVI